MALTPPPAVPQRGDRSTFSNRVDAFLTWMANLVGELNTFLLSLTRLAAGGANTFAYIFDGDTTDADPGPGKLRLSSATQNASTVLRLDTVAGDGSDISSLLTAFLAGTSAIKGTVRVQKIKNPSAYIVFEFTAATGTGYKNLTVTPRASSSATPFVNGDELAIYFDRTGDRGDAAVSQYMKVVERKAQNSAAQGLSASTANIRILNTTEVNSIAGASLTSSQVSLPAGIYDFRARAPASGVGGHQIQVQNVTSASMIADGSSAYAPSGSDNTDSFCMGRFTLTVTSVINVIHRVSISNSGGTAANVAMELYTQLEFWKVG